MQISSVCRGRRSGREACCSFCVLYSALLSLSQIKGLPKPYFLCSPVLAQSVKPPCAGTLRGLRLEVIILISCPFCFFLLSSQTRCLHLRFLFLSFKGFFLLLRVIVSSHGLTIKKYQEIQTSLHRVSTIIQTLSRKTEMNAAYRLKHITTDFNNVWGTLGYSFNFQLAQSIHASLWICTNTKTRE